MEEHKDGGFQAPGTFILALVFLISFLIYYFLNWKWLASVWPVS
jgi:cytochrome c oxidase subunit 1